MLTKIKLYTSAINYGRYTVDIRLIHGTYTVDKWYISIGEAWHNLTTGLNNNIIMNNNHKKLLNLFEKIHSEKKDDSGYSLGKSTIMKVFNATAGYTKEDLLARLTLIDSMYSTQMNRRYYGLDELAGLLEILHKKKALKETFLEYIRNKDFTIFDIPSISKNLFAEKYGIGKNGKDKGLAVSLISKYAYFETNFEFPIYDSIVREMYPRIWEYCGFDKKEMPKIERNDITMFINAIDTLKDRLKVELNSNSITYDTLDRILWYVGKIYRGNLSLVLSRKEYDAFAKQYTKFDIETADLSKLPIKKDSILYDFFALAKELKELDNKK